MKSAPYCAVCSFLLARVFDNIECEWPLFLCYIAINHLFCGEQEML